MRRVSYVVRRFVAAHLMRLAEFVEPDAVIATQWFEVTMWTPNTGHPPIIRRYCPKCHREGAGTFDHDNYSVRPPQECLICHWKPKSVLEMLAADHG